MTKTDTLFFHSKYVTSERILYTPSGFAKSSLLHLQEIGSLQARKPYISGRNDLASYLFILVQSGSGILQYDGQQYDLAAGDCVFIDCRKEYYHQTSENLWSLQWIHFNGPTLQNIYEKYNARGGLPRFHPLYPERFIAIWEQILHTAGSQDYIRDMRINESLNMLLTLLMEESWHPETQRKDGSRQNLLAVKNYLDENYRKKISLDELSSRFFINKFYLTRIFREQFGIPINNYLLQLRITHAKQLLRFTDATVESIGLECGIGAVNYFSRIFKKIEGISPSEYRKEWLTAPEEKIEQGENNHVIHETI